MQRVPHGKTEETELVPTYFEHISFNNQRNAAKLQAQRDVEANTLENLKNLGLSMQDPGSNNDKGKSIPDSGIPSAYTYFGQFVAHDISFDEGSSRIIKMAGCDLKPLRGSLGLQVPNTRSPQMDLDSVYGQGSVRDQDWMRIGRVSYSALGRPEGKDDYNDLPRLGRSLEKKEEDRVAQIGDPRNDENLILSQLHLAFLRAHNKLINLGKKFDEAKEIIKQHYQHIVLEDFLNRIADPKIVKRCKKKNKFFTPPKGKLFIPVEFSAAAFRFGHSMVRSGYNNFNEHTPNATLDQLFGFTRFGGDLGASGKGTNTLREDWIIEWEHFVGIDKEEDNHARRIDTTLVEPLFILPPGIAQPTAEASLAVRNLQKGFLLDLKTGQEVADGIGFTPLTKAQIESVAGDVRPEQLKAVQDGQFATNTPLWYYILAEAAHSRKKHKKDYLGPVGSTLVAEVLIEILRQTPNSILSPPYSSKNPWTPDKNLRNQETGKFELSDFLRFAGVLS